MPDAGKIKKISIRLSIVAAIALLLMLVTICSTEDVTVTRSVSYTHLTLPTILLV